MAESLGQPSSKSQEQEIYERDTSLYKVYLVDCEFERLQRKYHWETADLAHQTDIEHALSSLAIDRVKAQEGFANHLQFILLPQLLGQICSLSIVLELPSLLDEPESNLNLVLKLQKDLDCSLNQIQCVIAALCPKATFLPKRADDHHLKGFKSYRLNRVKMSLPMLAWDMCDIFESANELIQKTELSSVPSLAGCDADSLQRRFFGCIVRAGKAIQRMTARFKLSDLAIAQDLWETARGSIENDLQFVIRTLNRPSYSTTVENQSQQAAEFGVIIQLTKLMLPILKLSRMFLDKLSNRGLANERLPMFAEICSDQIDTLANSAGDVARDLRCLVQKLCFADGPAEGVTSDDLTSLAKSLKSRFESPLLLVLMYFVPLIPDPDGLNVPQKHYTRWCATWNNMMALATHNFTRVAESFVGIP
ncbi:hypothetical protein PTTG_28202 [Puccinia triticina 1-1 BBBD Race 1]|uniref:Uncharacterized protein n=1 Tax=Puccinia triticina (isolate 1-1 / race 1 (BBBD)) TaxID=630390 RepID=A0A180GDQ6_PUCT1|nr:hypothetical protein PTTG_28202 [Puccinia triticina 1-1 BBBD Race 1]